MSPIAKIALLRLALAELLRAGSRGDWMRLQPVAEAVEWLWTRTKQMPSGDSYDDGDFWIPMADDGGVFGFTLEHLALTCEEIEAGELALNLRVVFGKAASGEVLWCLRFSKGDAHYLRGVLEAWIRCLDLLLVWWLFLPPPPSVLRPDPGGLPIDLDGRVFDPSLVADRSEELRAAQALLLKRFPAGVAGLRLPSAGQPRVQELTASEVEALWAFV